MVKNDAEKFKKYIENLISYIKISNSDDARLMKFYFYPSRDDYNNNNYKFNIVGHSMGGLVARYYIENLEQDSHVHKLITICTPHWGSDLANLSNSSSIAHLLCDHDLDTNSAMYGGNNSDILNGGCSQVEITDLWTKCTDSTYALTDPLNYLYSPETIYYAIAGIDFDAIGINLPNLSFELDNFNTYDDLLDNIQAKAQDIAGTSLRELIDGSDYPVTRPIDVKIVTDNTVGFLSQIGWTRDYGDTPQKKVTMHKVFVNIDTNGGNDIVDHFHGKMTHRKCVIDCVIAYLLE